MIDLLEMIDSIYDNYWFQLIMGLSVLYIIGRGMIIESKYERLLKDHNSRGNIIPKMYHQIIELEALLHKETGEFRPSYFADKDLSDD